MKRYLIPLAGLVLGTLALYLVQSYVFVSIKATLMTILEAAALFAFGMCLSAHHRHGGSLRQVVVLILATLSVLIQLRALDISFINVFLARIGSESLLFVMLYVYLGYIFL